MSNYQIGAFEALEWVWHMLRNFKDQSSGVDKARQIIQDVLANMGEGAEVKFSERIPSS